MSLTYILHPGFRDLGEAACETNLLFLNADFVVADGSLGNVLRAMTNGVRLVAAPSYCVVSKDALPKLKTWIQPGTGALIAGHRELANLALRSLHNTVKGKILNQSAFHLRQMDQFYWQSDKNTLLGHQMPIAIVGMRPKHALDEPIAYWDHGLIREFCPTVAPYILGDSDDFLMIELRESEVAAEQILPGPVKTKEAGERMIGWVTPYQRDFAQYEITLHANDLPLNIGDDRAKLASRMRAIVSHSPKKLPSHRDHPQWHYHLGGFREARHQYLSTHYRDLTSRSAPPAYLTEIDCLWWHLDGLQKRHEQDLRILEAAKLSQMKEIQDEVHRVSTVVQLQKKRDAKIFHREYKSIHAHHKRGNHKSVEQYPFLHSADMGILNDEGRLFEKYKNKFTSIERNLAERIDILNASQHYVFEYYEREIARQKQRIKPEQNAIRQEYRKLLTTGISSAVVPHVRYHSGPGPIIFDEQIKETTDWMAFFARAIQKPVYRKALRHARTLSKEFSAKSEFNVLLIGREPHWANLAIDASPSLCAFTTGVEAKSGNLAVAISSELNFDMCVWELDGSEVSIFPNLVGVIQSCVRPGGAVIGFHINTAGSSVSESTLIPPNLTFETFVESSPWYLALLHRAQSILAVESVLSLVWKAFRKLAASKQSTNHNSSVRYPGRLSANVLVVRLPQ